MTGAIAVVVVIVLVMPPAMLMAGGVISAIFGWALGDNAEQENAGSELLETNY